MTYTIRDFRPGQRVWLDSGSWVPSAPAVVRHIGRSWVYLTVYRQGVQFDERARPDMIRPREEPQP